MKYKDFTAQKHEIFKQFSMDYRHGEIAERLNLSPNQFKRQLAALRRRFECETNESMVYRYGYMLGRDARAARLDY